MEYRDKYVNAKCVELLFTVRYRDGVIGSFRNKRSSSANGAILLELNCAERAEVVQG